MLNAQGKQTGSFVNYVMAGSPIVLPVVGDGATILSWSDRDAGTVIEVSEKRIAIQFDKATRTDSNGLSENQQYEFERNVNGGIYAFTLRRNGKWTQEGRKAGEGVSFLLGHRSQYRDPSY